MYRSSEQSRTLSTFLEFGKTYLYNALVLYKDNSSEDLDEERTFKRRKMKKGKFKNYKNLDQERKFKRRKKDKERKV